MSFDEHKIQMTNEDIICPSCRERLIPADIEEYWHCPYCDHAFERSSGTIDDFVVSPAVRHYLSTANRKFPAI